MLNEIQQRIAEMIDNGEELDARECYSDADVDAELQRRVELQSNRKWTAELSVAAQEFDCPLSQNDTLAEQSKVAIAEATKLIREYEIGSDASVRLFKRTKRDGRKYDRALYVYRDFETREIRVQR